MQQQIAQDLENARALLGDVAVSSTAAASGVKGLDGNSSPFSAHPNPKTKADMELFAADLAKYIVDNYSNKPLYPLFIEPFMKAIAEPLKDLEVRKAASALTVIANEKQRAAREAGTKKGKGKGKPQLGAVGSGGNKAAMSGRG
jgi:translation initiation factor 3 subunit J